MPTEALSATVADPRHTMVPRRHRVVWRHEEAADTVTLALEPIDDAHVSFRPGQFNMLYAFGVGEVPISISGGAPSGALFHTVRSVGAVTAALCEAPEGTVVGVRGPFGTDWGVDHAAGGDVVVVAGGIGLAPLRPVIHQVLATRPRFGKVSILIGVRSPQDLVFRGETESWRQRVDTAVEVTVDHASLGWRGHVGVVTELIPMHLDPGTVALVCGPEVMMRFAARTLIDRGLSPERILVSMERNMKCAIGVCGHCQFGPDFVCYGGPVFPYAHVARLMSIREV